jgi:aminopeptidase N
VVFAFFDGEELGFQGAKEFAKSGLLPLDKAFNINLDMVGLMKDNALLIACAAKPLAGSADDMLAKLQDYATPFGITIKKMEQGWQSSDQYAFYEHGNPFLFMFGGAMGNYDRITDTADHLDYVDMMRLTAFLWGALSKMEPPDAYARVDMGPPSGIVMGGKRAFIGTIPDFAADVRGVQLAGTVPGSPAEKAGLEEGDIIILVHGMDVSDLQSFSAILKDIKPGERVDMHILRGGIEIKVSMIAAERGEG